jgi:hypothetical protein
VEQEQALIPLVNALTELCKQSDRLRLLVCRQLMRPLRAERWLALNSTKTAVADDGIISASLKAAYQQQLLGALAIPTLTERQLTQFSVRFRYLRSQLLGSAYWSTIFQSNSTLLEATADVLRLDILLLSDVKLWKRLRQSLRELYLNTMVNDMTFKRSLGKILK